MSLLTFLATEGFAFEDGVKLDDVRLRTLYFEYMMGRGYSFDDISDDLKAVKRSFENQRLHDLCTARTDFQRFYTPDFQKK